MVGGEGNDKFVFVNLTDSTSSQQDVIEGFQSGYDVIDFTALNLDASQVTIDESTGRPIVSINDTDFSIDFVGISTIDHDDFLF